MRPLILAILSIPILSGQTASDLRLIYKEHYASRVVSLLCEAIRFQTVPGNKDALQQQAQWLARQATNLGLTYHDAGPVTQIDLPGAAGAPVLGLVVHGDVQPPGESGWSAPPFACTEKDGYVYGRGSADDKGPLVQALLAMAALRTAGRQRSYTIRLLVGNDEESENQDIATYLKSNKPPDVTLVLDSEFPAVVGEKAWDGLEVSAADPYRVRNGSHAQWTVLEADAGVAASIVPSTASVRLRRLKKEDDLQAAVNSLCPSWLPEGYRCEARIAEGDTVVTVTGRAAHSGMNIEGGRNALVFLANLLQDKLAASGAADLLGFAAMAGKDLHGDALGLGRRDPLWGRYSVNVATLKNTDEGKLQLTINLRRIPPLTHDQIKQHLSNIVSEYSKHHGAALEVGGYFQDEPFAVRPDAKLVRRLVAAYQRVTGQKTPPAISGGGTYARRLPNAIAFGMWFPGKPYTGHDVDERIPVADLHRGMDVLLEALHDLTSSTPITNPLQP